MIWTGDMNHGREIAHAAGVGFDFELDRVISRVTSEGNLLGGFAFTNFTGPAIHIHSAGFRRDWCTLELLWVVHHYPFEQLKVKTLFATVPSTNEVAKRQAEWGGYKLDKRIEWAVAGGDLLVYRMSRDECRWLEYTDRFLKREAA